MRGAGALPSEEGTPCARLLSCSSSVPGRAPGYLCGSSGCLIGREPAHLAPCFLLLSGPRGFLVESEPASNYPLRG